jgi:hypothetical protein
MIRRKLFPRILLFLILLAPLAAAQIHIESHEPHCVKLLATKGDNPGLIPIGEVRIWEDADCLYIKYMITNADWRLQSTHVYVTTRNPSFNPIEEHVEPIRLELEQAHRAEMEYTYRIPCQWPSGTHFCVAAKAEVLAINGYTSDIEGLIDSLPETLRLKTLKTPFGAPSYLQVAIIKSETMDGLHDGWCVDIDRPRVLRWYNAEVYTPYDKLPPGIMEFPENLDLVNWIINKDYAGKPAPSGGIYTFGDVQHAVWTLLEGRSTNYTKGPWDEVRATGIIDAAKAEGEGFIPGCFEKFLLILVPVNKNRRIHWQSMAIGITAPCFPIYSVETAWGLAWNVSWYHMGPSLTFVIQ